MLNLAYCFKIDGTTVILFPSYYSIALLDSFLSLMLIKQATNKGFILQN